MLVGMNKDEHDALVQAMKELRILRARWVLRNAIARKLGEI